MGEWQPIETAPKDGNDILLYDKYSGPFIGLWSDGGEWLADTKMLGIDGYATFTHYIDEQFITHWAPLDPPK